MADVYTQQHASDLDEEVGFLRAKNARLMTALEHAIDHLVRLDAFVDGQGYRPSIRATVALGRAALSLHEGGKP